MNTGTEQLFLLDSEQAQASSSSQKLIEIPGTTSVNLENVEDFSNVCRTCATNTGLVIPIFAGEGLQNHLADKIHKHLPIKVSETDELPLVVCYQCVSTLLAWHELVKCCVQADQALRSRIGVITSTDNTKGPQSTVLTSNDVEDDSQSKDDSHLDVSDESSDRSDDRPLSTIATKRSKDVYTRFYNALVNFRNHLVNEHKTEETYPDFTDSSSVSEVEDNNVDNFDDLTQCNMRKDRMDEETRLELSQVQTKINGKVFYTCRICEKNLSSAHTYVFHKRIHTGERPCVCHICGKQFRAPNGLQRHLTETHERLRRYTCPLCPKNFANSQNVKQHLRIHTGERPFVCSHCGKRFTQSGSLHVHLKTHSEQFPYQCAECGAKFRLRSGLARHRLNHTGERPHACAHCGKGFRQRHELTAHAASHSDTKPFACGACGAAFRARRALRTHTKRVHETELAPREPPQQSIVFNNINYTVQATKPQPTRDPPRYTPPLLRCEFCNTANTEATYSKHLIDEHSELIFHCEDCNRYIHKREFMSHMSQHADNYMRDIEIKFKKKNVDNSASTIRQQLAEMNTPGTRNQLMNLTTSESSNRNTNTASVTRSRHMYPPAKRSQNTTTTRNQNMNLSEEETPKPDTATQSSKIIKNNQENEFSDHSDIEYGFGPLPESVFEAIEDTQDSQIDDTSQQAETEDLTEIDDTTTTNEENDFKQPKSKKIRTCPICSKVYKASSSYFYHLKHTHKRIKEHECEICAKKFATKASLASHTTTHTGECQFECKQCKKRFRSNASLYIHEQTHTGIKTWSCKQCQTSFRWKTHLLRHMKRHLAEKSHTCSTCGRGFSIRCDLLRHARTHTAGEYPCEKCDVKFAQMRYLKVHMAKKHSAKARRKSKSK